MSSKVLYHLHCCVTLLHSQRQPTGILLNILLNNPHFIPGHLVQNLEVSLMLDLLKRGRGSCHLEAPVEVGQDLDQNLDQGHDLGQGQSLEVDLGQGQAVDRGDLEVDHPSALKADPDLVQQVDLDQEVGHDLDPHNLVEDHQNQVVDLQGQVVDLQGRAADLQGQVAGHQGQVVDLQGHVVDQGQGHLLQLDQVRGQMLALGMRVTK